MGGGSKTIKEARSLKNSKEKSKINLNRIENVNKRQRKINNEQYMIKKN